MTRTRGGATVRVVEYEERWAGSQTAFARRNWPGKPRRADPAYLRWEYRGPAEGPVPGLLLAVIGDEVVGQLGMIPGTLRRRTDLAPIQWIGNLMVDPERRRHGVSTAIFETALNRPVITVGTDPSPSAAATMATLGFARADSSDLLVLPLAAGPVVATRYPRLRPAVRVLDALGAPAIAFATRRLRAAQRDPSAQACSWRDVVADIQAAEAGLDVAHFVHDEAFLRWRCGGFAPWVREVDAVQAGGGSFAVFERTGDRVLVLHWHAPDDATAARLLGRLVYIAQGYGAAYVQAMAIDPRQRATLEGLAFRARRTPTDLWWYPGGTLGPDRTVVQGYDTDQNL